MSWHLMQWLLMTIVLPSALIFYVRIKPQSFKKTIINKLIMIPITLIVLLLSAFSYYAQLAPMFREHRQLKSEISPLNSISSLSSYAKSQFCAKFQGQA